MAEMSEKVESGRSGIDTSSQLFPPSRVSFTSPLLVPTHMSPSSTVEGEMDSIAPSRAPGPARPASAPLAGGFAPAGTPRSGLSLRQCAPPSVVAIRTWKPARSSCGFQGANTIGLVEVERRSASGSTCGLTLTVCSLGQVMRVMLA